MISQTAQIVRRLVSVLILASIVGCASQPVEEPKRSSSKSHVNASQSNAKQAATVALQQIGAPYRYGGSTPKGFDCSGLIYYSYSRVGRNVPRTTGSLWSDIEPIAKSQMQVGDVLFFRIEGKVSHVGMYIGGDQFVHAPSSGKVVTVGSLQSDFYRKALIRAGRPD